MPAVNPPPINIPDIPDKKLQAFLLQFKTAFYLLWSQAGSGTGIIPVDSGGTGGDSPATARANLGLGTIATQNAGSVAVTGGSVSGLTTFALDKTITAPATVGAQTIDKHAGSVNFAAAATSLVVTNNKVTTNSLIFASIATNDATARYVWHSKVAGSFTLRLDPAPTGETRVDFLVVN
jgi:hypothetical protein